MYASSPCHASPSAERMNTAINTYIYQEQEGISMAEHKTLQKALRQMAEGSRSAFHTFYLGSSQYVYSSALLLYDSHVDACRFMVDFYQYLYLHLPEYDSSQNLETWISRLLMDRYEQLSIGKHLTQPTVRQQRNSVPSTLIKSEQERIWRLLDASIHFPKESVRRSPIVIILLLSALVLLLLLASRYVPLALERLEAANRVLNSGKAADSGEETDTERDAESEIEEPEEELDTLRDELDDLLSERANAEADDTDDDTDLLLQQQTSGDTLDSGETNVPSAPSAPDTPQAPEPPQEPQTPSLSDRSDASSDLEDLELQLYYGDRLIHAGSD